MSGNFKFEAQHFKIRLFEYPSIICNIFVERTPVYEMNGIARSIFSFDYEDKGINLLLNLMLLQDPPIFKRTPKQILKVSYLLEHPKKKQLTLNLDIDRAKPYLSFEALVLKEEKIFVRYMATLK